MPLSAGEAYKGFSSGLSRRQKRIAKREGVLDPIGYIQSYNQRKDIILPLIAKQLQGYQAANPNKDMEKLMRDLPNLRNYLNNNLSALERSKMPYLTSSKTAAESIGNIFSSLEGVTDLDPRTQSLGSFAGKLALNVLPPVAVANIANLGGTAVDKVLKTAGMEEGKPKDILKQAGELAGLTAVGAGTEAAGFTKFKSVPDAIKKTVSKIQKEGPSKIIKKVVAKLGPKKAFTQLTKLGLTGVAGAVGGVFSGGALTAAMGALAVKDIIDIANIILED